MSTCRSFEARYEEERRKRSAAIDKRLQEDKKEMKSERKILLLGMLQ